MGIVWMCRVTAGDTDRTHVSHTVFSPASAKCGLQAPVMLWSAILVYKHWCN
jgi:hypothetical protein